MASDNEVTWACGAYGTLLFMKIQLMGAGDEGRDAAQKLQDYLDIAPENVKQRGSQFFAQMMVNLR